MATKELDILKRQAGRLSKEERLELIDSLIRTLKSDRAATYLQYGKYSGKPLSSARDFHIAEWQPSDSELNGN